MLVIQSILLCRSHMYDIVQLIIASHSCHSNMACHGTSTSCVHQSEVMRRLADPDATHHIRETRALIIIIQQSRIQIKVEQFVSSNALLPQWLLLCCRQLELFHILVTRIRIICLLYTSPSPRDATLSRMPSSA